MKLSAIFAFLALSVQAAELSLNDVEGAAHRPLADAGQAATVLFFVLHDCPISNGYAPEISRIAQEYAGRGVRSFVVYGEGDLAPAEARKHARDYGWRCPALLDPPHALARVAGATVAPEAAVFSAKGEVLYRGRIDDRLRLGMRQAENHSLQLEASEELSPARWQPVYLPGTGPTYPSTPRALVIDVGLDGGMRFYRVRSGTP